ncbi:SulP family inorganic anion transporter [Tautonia sociabilis]|uniref:Permease n=1 Tax=Tautonia sociabilis TaxID=2080755 RepID=A0A432MMZ5_9BACT|nr:permease [Tautonia sociabilis]RUL88438.1 permease [Tautonia sociabilis]
MDDAAEPSRRGLGYEWASKGDVNAFFGLMLDNVSGLIITTSLLVNAFEFPASFVLRNMIPGTALGVLVGDLIFSVMAFRLSSKSGKPHVTAMPLGLDTPSIFGTALLIVGPAFVAAKGGGMEELEAARHAWYIGIGMLLASGVFKVLCAPASGWIRRVVPRAGLLGSLAAIALVVISFLPLTITVSDPVPGLVALAVILATLTARWRLPWGMPGALGAVLVGSAVYYGLLLVDRLLGGPGAGGETLPVVAAAGLPMPMGDWFDWMQGNWPDALNYLPIALPLALATVVGGIDCTESAAAAGDDYPTGQIIFAEGLATLAAGVFGGVIQTTPYIGHPAYKAMGGRAAYTLATAVFIGAAGMLGFFVWIFRLLPEVVVYPILVFIALEITAQSFLATPRKHYPALALAVVPALAYLINLSIKPVLADPALLEAGIGFEDLAEGTRRSLETVTMLAGGFILTSLLWATALARLIDGRFRSSAMTFLLAGALALFGVIHSPLPSERLMLPTTAVAQMKTEGRFGASRLQTPFHWAISYAGMAGILLAIGRFGRPPGPEDHEE